MSDDFIGAIDELADVNVGGRTGFDRYREFRQVFLDSDAGKRVLYDILSWGHIYRTSMHDNPYRTSFKEGERSLALRIIATIRVQPKPERPQRATETGET